MTSVKHVAIIMDGNGRYAQKLGKERTFGHYEGVKNVRNIAIHASEKGVECLTVYAFSTENWKRPVKEVSYLMSLPRIFFSSYLKQLMEKNIRVTMIGRMDHIPEEARYYFERAIAETAGNTGMILNFAMNYGSRDEIVEAARRYAEDYRNGVAGELDESLFSKYLMTAELPDVDLLIRTSGEQRISNFLLYQIAYAELVFSPLNWPEFDEAEFDRCLEEFYKRNRRFGGLNEE
ncbi:MAG: isoprenyl transferase [Erysipelotrichaceae bacterium]|nr:isoprenyl transferase [Erysipelotrichaceae bacterium]